MSALSLLLSAGLLASAAPASADAPAPAAAADAAQETGPRPGFIEIPAGTVLIGTELEDAKELVRQDPEWAGFYGGEVPRHRRRVETFWISPTPVTNEMYLEYVRDVGCMPPPGWAVISRELRQELILAGKDPDGDGEFERPEYVFDVRAQAEWWAQHWQDEGREWRMPPDAALEPVVFVSYRDVLGYCRWAGVRPPTETEWTRSARGDTDRPHPYGDEFRRDLVAHNATKPDHFKAKRLPVATFPENASPFGVLDLTGLVYEWTSTPYTRFEGYESFTVEVEDGDRTREISAIADFNPGRRVVKGGGFQQSALHCRIDMRVGVEPSIGGAGLGFRVAQSLQPWSDAAWTRSRRVRSAVLRTNPLTGLAFARSLGFEKRSYPDMQPIVAARAQPEPPIALPESLPDEYRVFGPAEVFAFTPLKDPAADFDHPTVGKLERVLKQEHLFMPLGVLSSSVAFEAAPGGEPIPAGDYALLYMPAHKERELEAIGAWIAGDEGPTPIDDDDLDDFVPPNVDVKPFPLEPDTGYVLVADNEGTAIGVVKLENTNGEPELSRNYDTHEMRLNLDRDRVEFLVRFPGAAGRSYGFHFSLRPVDDDGGSLVRRGWWDGDHYAVIEPKPEPEGR